MPAEPIALRYGLNPHQAPASAAAVADALPFDVLNGLPGYINLLDALSAWQLVRELDAATGLPAAASFKHVSPAGAAVADPDRPISDALAAAYEVDASALSPVATAYARARGGDLVSSYGDFAAVSRNVDASLAEYLRREVSDGIIAPGFDPDARDILDRKKGGRYLLLQADPGFQPPEREIRELFGVRLAQPADLRPLGAELFADPVTERAEFPPDARRDLLIAGIALRYAQSNSVCLAADGQVIGLGAGQQSRIHCTRIACAKADRWMLQQHPKVRSLKFKPGLRRADRFTAREQYIAHQELSAPERERLRSQIEDWPGELDQQARAEWLANYQVVLSHDAFIPFRDNIDRAQASHVRYILQPGGSQADPDVTAACNEYQITMSHTHHRLFRH